MRKEKDWHETQEIKWYIKKEGLGKEILIREVGEGEKWRKRLGKGDR